MFIHTNEIEPSCRVLNRSACKVRNRFAVIVGEEGGMLDRPQFKTSLEGQIYLFFRFTGSCIHIKLVDEDTLDFWFENDEQSRLWQEYLNTVELSEVLGLQERFVNLIRLSEAIREAQRRVPRKPPSCFDRLEAWLL